MKIIINAYQYSPSITGTDRMASNFLRELQKIDTTNTYYIVCSSEQYIQPIITASNFTVLQPKHFLPGSFTKRVVNKLWRTLLPWYLSRFKADVYFSFHNMRLPHRRVATQMIASNLDLIPLKFDEYKNLSPGQVEEIKQTAQTADAFMSISEYSKQELCSTLAVDPKKVHVIHLAADPLFDGKPHPASFDLPPSFIFTIGGSEPRKNVDTIAKAFAQLPPALQKSYPLLIVGGSWHDRPLDPLRLSPHIQTLGYVSDTDLASLYAHTTAFIFASQYEGFGFTLLEAMAYGAPVLSATGSSLDEVAGTATLSFEPNDADSLATFLQDVLTKPAIRKNLQAASRKQAQEFSWAKSAKQLHSLLTGMIG
ncbi:MAG TPA: glycosyltransferase family 1 protein [Verrucomicrobiae bacterium]|nr:glycosyltransferase family 1 protein [Verrucomicrobiae bacterium]